jgi:hypothetical protein
VTRAGLTTLSFAAFALLVGSVLVALGLTGNALVQTNGRLADIDGSLQSIKGHADPLAFQVGKINDSLASIEQSLQPLHGQADQLNGILGGVQQTLTSADGTLKSIQCHVTAAEADLVPAEKDLSPTGTDGYFKHINPNVGDIQGKAVQAVTLLMSIESDLATIEGKLVQTRDHLVSSCDKLPSGLPGSQGGAGCG